jgi:hypothetical protein
MPILTIVTEHQVAQQQLEQHIADALAGQLHLKEALGVLDQVRKRVRHFARVHPDRVIAVFIDPDPDPPKD